MSAVLSALRALRMDHSRTEPHHEGICLICRQADEAIARVADMEHDLLVLALRLYSESPDTFAIETERVMRRMRPLCEAEMGIVAEPAVCPTCFGSGDGYHEGEACSACGGWGLARDKVAA